MLLALIALPLLAIGGCCALVAIAPRRMRGLYVLPAVRTVALITLATIYVAALWSHP